MPIRARSCGRSTWADAPTTIGAADPARRPTVEDGLVYALEARARWCASAPQDGSEVWRTHLVDELGGTEPNWGYASRCLLDGDLLLCTPGGEEGAIAALDKATGEVLWRATELDDTAHYSSILRAESTASRSTCNSLKTARGHLTGRWPPAMAIGISRAAWP